MSPQNVVLIKFEEHFSSNTKNVHFFHFHCRNLTVRWINGCCPPPLYKESLKSFVVAVKPTVVLAMCRNIKMAKLLYKNKGICNNNSMHSKNIILLKLFPLSGNLLLSLNMIPRLGELRIYALSILIYHSLLHLGNGIQIFVQCYDCLF